MNLNVAGRTFPIAAVIAGIGGLLAILGVLLPWYSQRPVDQITGHLFTMDYRGLDSVWGIVALALGVAIIGLSVVWGRLRFSKPLLLACGVAIVVIAALSFLTALFPYTLTAYNDQGVRETGHLPVGWSVQRCFDEVSKLGGSSGLGMGFFLEMVAAGMTVAGGVLGLVRRSARAPLVTR
jgi:hypothetical protein